MLMFSDKQRYGLAWQNYCSSAYDYRQRPLFQKVIVDALYMGWEATNLDLYSNGSSAICEDKRTANSF